MHQLPQHLDTSLDAVGKRDDAVLQLGAQAEHDEVRHGEEHWSEPTDRPGRNHVDWSNDRGEGVISAAIAVLIVAFLGVGMWTGFNAIWTDIETQTQDQITQIGTAVDGP